MSFEVVADSLEDREGWLEARRSGIGGSDIPAILGLSSWQSPLSVYVDKIGLGDQAEIREQQEWGLLLEPVILERFAAVTGRLVHRAGKLLRSKELPFALCTLDGEQVKTDGSMRRGNVQVKNYGGYVKWSDAVPPEVYAQVQWEMGVTEAPFSSAVALLNGNKMVWADIEFDDAFFSGIAVPAAMEFWERVQKLEPPKADGSDISKQALSQLYPMDDGTEIHLDQRFLDLDDELWELKLKGNDTEVRAKAIENEIRAAIGPHTFGILPSGVVYTYRHQHRDSYTVKPSDFRVLLRRRAKK